MNKKTKMFYGNQYVGSFNCDGKKYTKTQIVWFKIRKITKQILTGGAYGVIIGWIAVGALHIGLAQAKTVEIEKQVVKEVRVKAPVMERILKCESGGTHIDPKTGQVLIRTNTNKSYDQGKYQINSIWNKKATELGLNLLTEKDNEAFAYYLYENFGTSPWYSSAKCWDK